MATLPDGLIAYGPDTNCTLDICPVEWSVLEYRPSLAASGTYIGLFSIVMVIQILQGIRWGTWGYMTCMMLGCIDEIIGYSGRIMLYYNPFSFSGFLIQIICITTAPVFFCAAIYVTLSNTINHLDPSISRFSPRLLYWIFIPCDVISLAFQAGGGAESSVSTGSNNVGVNVSLFGLSFQVFTLVIFILVMGDYLIRYFRTRAQPKSDSRTKVFLSFLSLSTLLILARCIYRIDELREGYRGDLMHNEPLFIALEGAVMITAVFCLCIGHPGYGRIMTRKNEKGGSEPATE